MIQMTSNDILLLRAGHVVLNGCTGGWNKQSLAQEPFSPDDIVSWARRGPGNVNHW